MRSDLAKLTTERERRGRGYAQCYKLKFGGKVRIHPDPEHDYPREAGGFHSSARRRHREYKSFSDVLRPLLGAIRSNLGRPWNDVFSDFCQVLDRRGVSGYHIWTHLMQEVETKTYLGEDGNVYKLPGGSSYRVSLPVSGFYVHPISGLLLHREDEWTKKRVKERWAAKNRKETRIPVPEMWGWRYEEIDGLWFRCFVEIVKGPDGRTEAIFKKFSANRREIAWIKTQL